MKHNVFVYGTLKKGHHNNALLNSSTFLGNAETEAEFSMYCNGGYPGVVMGGFDSIKGEVYEINDKIFSRLDSLEGYPNLYNRIEISTTYGVAWLYIYNRPITNMGYIENGHWCPNG